MLLGTRARLREHIADTSSAWSRLDPRVRSIADQSGGGEPGAGHADRRADRTADRVAREAGRIAHPVAGAAADRNNRSGGTTGV